MNRTLWLVRNVEVLERLRTNLHQFPHRGETLLLGWGQRELLEVKTVW